MSQYGYTGRRHNGYALTLIVGGHLAVLTALMMYRMEVPLKVPNLGIETKNIPIDPPPPVEVPPPPKRTAEAPQPRDRSDITTVPPVFPVPSDGPVVEPSRADDIVIPFAADGPVDVPGPKIVPAPTQAEQPPIQPRFKPVAAKPSGNPSAWVTNDDYPDSALRNEEQGRTAFRLAIGADGRPTSCTVTASSGARALDDAACRLLMRRARFTAAKDADGAAVAGTYANSFLWQIPED